MKNRDLNQAQKLAQLSFRLEKICQEKDNFFAHQFNLTATELRCLSYLQERDYFTVKELATQMGLTSSRITHIITSLEKKGYIKRELDVNDRRNIKVMLTEKAHDFTKEVNNQHIKLHQGILTLINPDKREMILESLQELHTAMQHWSEIGEKK